MTTLKLRATTARRNVSGDGVFHGSVRKEKSHDGARSHGLTLSAQYDGCNTSRRKARPQNVGIIDAAQRSERYAPLDASNYNLALDGGGTGLATRESCVLYGIAMIASKIARYATTPYPQTVDAR
jgi:hypothetical protein